jgi:hypothetical protein
MVCYVTIDPTALATHTINITEVLHPTRGFAATITGTANVADYAGRAWLLLVCLTISEAHRKMRNRTESIWDL